MKYLLILSLFFSQLSFSQDRGCIDHYEQVLKKVKSKLSYGSSARQTSSALGIISGTVAFSASAFYVASKGKESPISPEVVKTARNIMGVSAGVSVGTFAVEKIRKGVLKRRKKDIKKVIGFMGEATVATGELFDEALEDFRQDYPYLYAEELAEVAFKSFIAPQPNALCPVGKILKYKKFIEVLKREVGFYLQREGEL